VRSASATEERGRPSGRAAGTHADERVRRGRRSFRRRNALHILGAVVVLAAVSAAILALPGRLPAFVAGLVVGIGVAVALTFLVSSPDRVLHWGLGAEGERRTAEVLRLFERGGWRVFHDVPRERGSIDLLLVGPAGVFVLETKALRGSSTVENGVLTSRSLDDPEDVYASDRPRPGLLTAAAEVAERLGTRLDTTIRVHAVVVIWGTFDQGVVEEDRIAYVHGDRLADWLRTRPADPNAGRLRGVDLARVMYPGGG
jgi:hypothetical protein